MSYGSQRSSRRSTGRGRGKVHHEKGKKKGPKHSHGGKYLLSESEAPTFEEVVEKTLGRMSSLGGQTFAFSPFSPYYDDWLLSLKSVLSELESNPAVNVDEEFVKERSQVIADVELKLVQRRREDDAYGETTRMLAENKTLLVQTDTEYSYANQELAAERKSEIKRLTHKVRDLEEELEEIRQNKVSVFSPLARRSRSKKKTKLNRELDASKSQLDTEVKALEAEQEKLRVGYEKKKQAITEQVQSLEKKISGAETDGSVEDRRFAGEELINIVKNLLQRKKSLHQNEQKE